MSLNDDEGGEFVICEIKVLNVFLALIFKGGKFVVTAAPPSISEGVDTLPLFEELRRSPCAWRPLRAKKKATAMIFVQKGLRQHQKTSGNLCRIERDSGRLSSALNEVCRCYISMQKGKGGLKCYEQELQEIFVEKCKFDLSEYYHISVIVLIEMAIGTRQLFNRCRQKRKLDEMYDLLRTEVESMKRSTIQPVNHSFSIQEPDLFSNPETRMDSTNSIRKGETLTFAEARKAAFVLVARVLEERLGYNGIKVALPLESVTGTCFLQHYIESILALQEASCKLAEARKLVIGWCSQLATT
ncbi:UDP-sugar pyrophosphorylase [Perilla frutescens var. frutescens]|nr:UDP-sugar pyrophosphorylase [Perilla frutescens var. frutescens]